MTRVVASGKRKAVKVRMTVRTKRRLASKGGRLAVRTTTAFGKQRFTAAAATRVRKLR